MKLNSVRYIFGWTILVTHFATIIAFLYFGLQKLEGIAPVVGGVLTIVPLTTLYVTAFLRHVVLFDEQSRTETRIVSMNSFYVQLTIILLFGGFLLFGTIYLFATAVIDFDNIGVYTGMMETLFAAYMAVIFNNLFPDTMPKHSRLTMQRLGQTQVRT